MLLFAFAAVPLAVDILLLFPTRIRTVGLLCHVLLLLLRLGVDGSVQIAAVTDAVAAVLEETELRDSILVGGELDHVRRERRSRHPLTPQGRRKLCSATHTPIVFCRVGSIGIFRFIPRQDAFQSIKFVIVLLLENRRKGERGGEKTETASNQIGVHFSQNGWIERRSKLSNNDASNDSSPYLIEIIHRARHVVNKVVDEDDSLVPSHHLCVSFPEVDVVYDQLVFRNANCNAIWCSSIAT